jgi:hypothetical protein
MVLSAIAFPCPDIACTALNATAFLLIFTVKSWIIGCKIKGDTVKLDTSRNKQLLPAGNAVSLSLSTIVSASTDEIDRCLPGCGTGALASGIYTTTGLIVTTRRSRNESTDP